MHKESSERSSGPNQVLPFVWLDKRQVLAACPFKSTTSLYMKIAEGVWPKPYKFGSRSLWRSDEIATANSEYAAVAAREREALSARSSAKAKRAVASRKVLSA